MGASAQWLIFSAQRDTACALDHGKPSQLAPVHENLSCSSDPMANRQSLSLFSRQARTVSSAEASPALVSPQPCTMSPHSAPSASSRRARSAGDRGTDSLSPPPPTHGPARASSLLWLKEEEGPAAAPEEAHRGPSIPRSAGSFCRAEGTRGREKPQLWTLWELVC